MTIYTVMIPPGARPGEMTDEAFDRTVFIKEGFCWPALFVAIPWMLVHRLWLVLLVYLVVGLLLEASAQALGGAVPGVVAAAFSLLVALEANELRRWTLERRGWRLAGVVEGATRIDAERRFFAGFAAAAARAPDPAPAAAPAPPSPPAPARAPRIGGPQVIGFTPAPPRGTS
ncbi:DUF2628 domain-containing protein [Stappia sp.]|uniref:DUF2628 domain-containing protein n=1 Tax=Stappia sp. TaxID=1870903 RepID=UPI0032D8CDCB